MEALHNYDSSGSDDEGSNLGSAQTETKVVKKLEKSLNNFDKIYEKNQLLPGKSCDLEHGRENIKGKGAVVTYSATETTKEKSHSTQGPSCYAKTSDSSLNKNTPLNNVKAACKTSDNKSFSSKNTNYYSGLYFTTSNRCNYICMEKNEINKNTSSAGPIRKNPEVKTAGLGMRTKPYVSKREREKLKEKTEPGIPETRVAGWVNNFDNTEMPRNEHVDVDGWNVSNRPPRKVWIQFQAHSQCVNHVKWNPKKQNLLASASMDQTVAIWDTNRSGLCLNRLTYHEGAVKDVKWSACGTQVLSCGYDKCARLVDLETGKQIKGFDHQGYVTCVQYHPTDPNLFLSGTSRHGIFSWDIRDNKIVSSYKASFGQVQDVAFLPDGEQFISAAEVLRRNATDKGIMVWDFKTTAIMSNQIYQEAFTCTCLRVHPSGSYFVGQSNGNYMAIFSTKRPYKLNKYKRYEGHQVAAYSIGCDFSPDGTLAISGSADGKMYVYDSHTSHNISSLSAHPSVCIDVTYHPSMPSTVATCALDGQIVIWV